MATVIIASIVAILFVAIIASEIHKKKTGKSSCGCSCGGVAVFLPGDPRFAPLFFFAKS